ncbi:helix-turn-helix domain-containing protein [Acinetobacter johnsonii]|uniref:Helix-turn-helix domain-containing protein n=1 Tax=Acinetobacter johnsonii TaxID=40214 RepID=A0AA42LEV1_ACIJO|nr:helix-turn-helix domain-containing protein [Acinetobacter johnsonii]MDH0657327.1 helix-turn-helix domain-containing protein [Acinetobacter johnsonii]QQT57223.1 helix-turn-helix domain-containing protein [Acinetobacter johnsonii]
MSLDATIWAWRAEVDSSTQRLILLSLADRAGEDHKCYPSIMRMVKDTKMNRKTIIKVLDDLEKKALIKFTGSIVGNGVKVYQLLGVVGREDHPTSTKKGTSGKNGTSSNLGTGSNIGTSTENGTSTSPKNGTETSTEIGTQNLPRNLPIESKNKKDWLCSKKLREEITLADDSIEPETLMTAKWVEREKRAFEIYNQDKTICDELLNFYFADWLLHAYRTKYSQETKTGYAKTPAAEPKQLTEKQISAFAQKLAHHPEFASKQSAPGDSYEQLASRIAIKLMNPAQAKKWEPYLKQVGFTGSLQGAA